MNLLVAHLMSNLTASMRFPGSLNIDLNEITMNLVPFPRMHFLQSSLAPLYSIIKTNSPPRPMDLMFQDILHQDFQLIQSNPIKHKYLALGMLIRGEVAFSDVSRNIDKIKKKVNMINWNSEGFKYGICSVSSVNYK